MGQEKGVRCVEDEGGAHNASASPPESFRSAARMPFGFLSCVCRAVSNCLGCDDALLDK